MILNFSLAWLFFHFFSFPFIIHQWTLYFLSFSVAVVGNIREPLFLFLGPIFSPFWKLFFLHVSYGPKLLVWARCLVVLRIYLHSNMQLSRFYLSRSWDVFSENWPLSELFSIEPHWGTLPTDRAAVSVIATSLHGLRHS